MSPIAYEPDFGNELDRQFCQNNKYYSTIPSRSQAESLTCSVVLSKWCVSRIGYVVGLQATILILLASWAVRRNMVRFLYQEIIQSTLFKCDGVF